MMATTYVTAVGTTEYYMPVIKFVNPQQLDSALYSMHNLYAQDVATDRTTPLSLTEDEIRIIRARFAQFYKEEAEREQCDNYDPIYTVE